MAADTSAFSLSPGLPACPLLLDHADELPLLGQGAAALSCMSGVPVRVGMPIHLRGGAALARHGVHHHAISQADDQGVLLGRPDTLCSAHLQAGSNLPA